MVHEQLNEAITRGQSRKCGVMGGMYAIQYFGYKTVKGNQNIMIFIFIIQNNVDIRIRAFTRIIHIVIIIIIHAIGGQYHSLSYGVIKFDSTGT